MHICIISSRSISDKDNWGGVHTHAEMFCRVFEKLGHGVTLITSPYREGLTEESINGTRIVYTSQALSKVGNAKWLEMVGQIFLSIHKQDPFSCVFSEGNYVYPLIKKENMPRLPFFHFVHNPSFAHFYNNFKEVQNPRGFISYIFRTIPKVFYRVFFWEKPLVRYCAKVISVSALRARQLCRFYRVDSEKVAVINNWVDTSFFSPDGAKRSSARKIWSIAEDALVFLAVGNLWRPKGFHIAIEAFSKIAERFPGSFLLICGSGNEKDRLSSLIGARKLEDKVRFLGEVRRPGMPEIYNMADIFLMPSLLSEAHSYVLIEAMGSGLPVIASRRGGNIETVGDAGVLTQPGDVDSLAKAMFELANNSQRREALCQESRKRVLKLFSEETAIKKISELLNDLEPEEQVR